MNKKMLLLITPGLALILLITLMVGCTPTTTSAPGSISTSPGWTTFTTDDGLASNIVTSITQDKQGIIWVAGEGLTRFDGTHWEICTGSPGNTYIVCAARDKQDSLWFGTSREGAYEYTETLAGQGPL